MSPGMANRIGGDAGAGRFTSLLQSRTEAATGTARQMRESVEDDVAARIRGGRTDAAKEAHRRGNDELSRERSDGERLSESRREAGRPSGREAQETGPKRRQEAVAARSGEANRRGAAGLSSRERGLALTDAADAADAGSASEELETQADAPLAPVLQQVAPPQPTGPAMGPAMGPATGAAGGARAAAKGAPAIIGNQALAASAKAGPQTSNPTATPALGSATAAKTARVQQAAPKQGSTALERADAILDQLRMRIRAGDREATIQLNPAELGRMRMKVRVGGGAVSATIAAENPETLALLEAHAPELRSWLSRDGAATVELELELLTPSDTDERSEFERAHTDGRSPRGQRGPTAAGSSEQIGPASESLVQALATRSADGGVDFIA